MSSPIDTITSSKRKLKLAIISIILLIGTLTFISYEYYLLHKEYNKVYKDNCILINMMEKQNTTVNKLIKAGWSKEKAEDFVQQGCLMYIEVM